MKKLSTVVLIDDNEASNYISKRVLNEANIVDEIFVFQKGDRALDHLGKEENGPPDLILCDINMPTMDAWEFLEKFGALKRKDFDNSMLVLLSNSLNPEDKEKAKSFNVVKHILLKPLKIEQLKKIIG